MDILVLSDIEATGEWLSTQNMIFELKKRNPDFIFYLIAYGKNQMFLDKRLFSDIILVERQLPNAPFRYYKQIFWEFKNSLEIYRRFKKKVNRVDLIIATEFSFILPSFISFPFTKSIFCLQGFRHNYELGLENINFYAFLRVFLERFAWFMSSIIIIPSEEAKKIVKKKLGIFAAVKKISILPNIIHPQLNMKYSKKVLEEFKKKLNISPSYKLILYVGRIDQTKGLENLLSAFILFRKRFKKNILIIAYPQVKKDTYLFKKLSYKIRKNNIGRYVLFLKDLSRNNLSKLYQICDCGILPSTIEMGSLFLLESLSFRLPIFSSRTGNADSLLKPIDPLFILEDNSSQTIFNALTTFFQKDKKWQKKIKLKIEKITKEMLFSNGSVKYFERLIYSLSSSYRRNLYSKNNKYFDNIIQSQLK